MNCPDFIGQVLDGKYQMTRELGKGGMGTVYLATHLGTERPVAVKIIAPQFMQRSEFVERFRREARAAGRLRHPNVVDVTDFGFADTKDGQVAYLVMEYLDGCTLGEILEEEKNLPIAWSLDILEQVCSAVHEAHVQGIIHRDLKPDNIWLEPNQRGGYTVKVLDFGIAKLEENDVIESDDLDAKFRSSLPTIASGGNLTFGGAETDGTHADGVSDTKAPGTATIAHSVDQGTLVSETGIVSSEGKTAIFDDGDVSDDFQDSVGTKIISTTGDTDRSLTRLATPVRSLYDSSNSADLTRVGSVLGTPLYMSPEQCRGEHLDPRSDIYSLGVIAYQMLSGAPPFEGDFKDVMESHKSVEPAPLDAKNVRRKMKRAIHSALAKDPNERPQTAEAFASVMRARYEGIFGLLRRALVIYSEHLPKFIMLTGFFSLPIIVLTILMIVLSFLKVSDVISETTSNVLVGTAGFALSIASAFCTYLVIGTITWIVTQYLAVPLRPIRLRPALVEARKKWKTFAGTGILNTVLVFVIGIVTCGVGFIVLSVFWTLSSPVVMMENLKGWAALKRSKELVKRSVMTAAAAVFIMFLIPALTAGTISAVVNLAAYGLEKKVEQIPSVDEKAAAIAPQKDESAVSEPQPATGDKTDAIVEEKDGGFVFNWGRSRSFRITGEANDMQARVKMALLESIIQLIWLPVQILVLSFSGIIVALLYLKTRLAGGESMNDLIERFEDDERPRKRWQERVRQRLIQSGRIPSKP
ncbi:MAG: serine/threonine protein kinase [Chloracidobacterium sp.]|nr:serine/threonine protein kinase [Chloracidobacterium sp.]